MKEIIAIVGAICALMIVAFNPQLVTGVFNMAISPIQQWKENPNDVKGASDILIDAPNFGKGEEGQEPAARFMREDVPGVAKQGKGAGYGGGAVAVQRAKGL